MANQISEVSSQSWFSRIGGAFKGILVGILLFLGAGMLLFWNEGRAVKRHQALEEGLCSPSPCWPLPAPASSSS